MITKHEALETLDRLEFFNGQRAGRELWFEKNSNLQDIDIACFVRDISNLREYIQTADVSHRADWISVEERLPETEGWYLVYTAPDKKHRSVNKAEFFKGFEWNNFEPYWHGAGGNLSNVTHWMPLPEPPKGE